MDQAQSVNAACFQAAPEKIAEFVFANLAYKADAGAETSRVAGEDTGRASRAKRIPFATRSSR